VLRHSTAHLLAQAVQRLHPGAQVTIGPVIDNGFYYDFAYERPFTPEDLPAIEAEMQKIVKEALPVSRSVKSRDDAVAFFKGMGEHYKAEIIESIPANEDLSLYSQGEFTDLCRGPHVPGTDKLRAFKLMKVAGAYWRGDSNNQMLSRIYGTAWLNDKDLKAYLHQLEEAEKRDHRKIAKQQDLFHLQEEGPGPDLLASRRAGRCGRSWSSTCAASTARPATARCAARRSSTCRCGSPRATGTTTRTTCSSPSRRSAPTRSSR
jgi:threonyl-tRNA synthetase